MIFLRLFSAALCLVGLHGLTGTAAFAAQHYDGPIVADVVSVYVGDTLTVDAHPWPQITMRVSVRVNGIDTPEIRGKCEEEKVLAQNARTLTKEMTDQKVLLRNIFLGKYAGRVVADVYAENGAKIAETLVSQGIAYRYDGGARRSWCSDDTDPS